MSENTRKKVVYACFVIAVIYGSYNLLMGDDQPQMIEERQQQATNVSAAIHPAVPSPSSPELIVTDDMISAPWGADPFRDRVTPETALSPRPNDLVWVLDGIVYSDRSPMAIINKQMVRSGDTVDKARVIAIGRKTATLEHKGKQFTLTVSKG
ncbi:MAG: hypothetical protein KAU35_03045 [candidate division Zixibacteria bacterium]|nr:hypothetical protein [candidate division Zixibacteria bacterium]